MLLFSHCYSYSDSKKKIKAYKKTVICIQPFEDFSEAKSIKDSLLEYFENIELGGSVKFPSIA
jgi:hypothetical protein